MDPDIRLGDVVIGTPSESSKMAQGVMGGREYEEEFQPYDTALANTSRFLRNTFSKIETEIPGRNSFAQFLPVSVER